MLDIYASTFMTATRAGCTKLYDVPPKTAVKKRRWLPDGHWWLQSSRCVDLNRL